MSLYEEWTAYVYDAQGKAIAKHWDEYTPRERGIYERLLGGKQNSLNGTVKSIAEDFGLSPVEICGFIDGINGALNSPVELQELTEESEVDISFEFESLYKKMVEYKADELYSLPEWDGVFDAATRERLYREQKLSGTVRRADEKVGRNDPCPCGSGQKYKKCCGK